MEFGGEFVLGREELEDAGDHRRPAFVRPDEDAAVDRRVLVVRPAERRLFGQLELRTVSVPQTNVVRPRLRNCHPRRLLGPDLVLVGRWLLHLCAGADGKRRGQDRQEEVRE
jgi:hypothetical protein